MLLQFIVWLIVGVCGNARTKLFIRENCIFGRPCVDGLTYGCGETGHCWRQCNAEYFKGWCFTERKSLLVGMNKYNINKIYF